MAGKIEDLREHLFATLAALRDPTAPMDIERAKAVAEVAKVIVDSAKVENEHMKLTGADGSGFIPTERPTAHHDSRRATARQGQGYARVNKEYSGNNL